MQKVYPTSKNIALGNASYGFREYSLPELFAASREIGLTWLEIDCGWLEEESRNKIGVNASPQELDAVQRMAEEAGVKATALGGAVVGCTAMWPRLVYVSRRSIS